MDEFAKTVQSDPKLAGGFNVVGLSQGGLVVRGYIQQYNNPPVYDLGGCGCCRIAAVARNADRARW